MPTNYCLGACTDCTFIIHDSNKNNTPLQGTVEDSDVTFCNV